MCSEPAPGYLEIFSWFVHRAAGDGTRVMTHYPPTIHERDFLELAARQHWDIAFLLLNNICFPSKDRSPSGLTRDAGNLIRKMKQLFGKPIVCFYGYPDEPEFARTVILSGGDCLFRIPSKTEEVVPALRYHLDQLPGL
jgi:hypothetical protein